MTDRFHSLTVVLERDTRDDDCESLILAIKQLRGVMSVTGTVATPDSHMAEQRALMTLRKKLYGLLE